MPALYLRPIVGYGLHVSNISGCFVFHTVTSMSRNEETETSMGMTFQGTTEL